MRNNRSRDFWIPFWIAVAVAGLLAALGINLIVSMGRLFS